MPLRGAGLFHTSIAEFRRMHREAVTAAGAQLVRFAQSCGLIRGEWVAIDGINPRRLRLRPRGLVCIVAG
jgi:hypothetical protein